MKHRILELAQKLIQYQSTKDNPQALDDVLNEAKKILKSFTPFTFISKSSPSLLYSNTKKIDRFTVLLNAHLDVVPGNASQFTPKIKGDKLYGRGAYDMKSASAVEILLFSELAHLLPYSFGLQLVTDEEVGGFNGTKYQIEKGVRTEFIIAGEPTNFGINNKAKGIVWLQIHVKGKTAHGAYPWQGKNALRKLHTILTRLHHVFPEPTVEVWKTTVNVARIETSNQTYNKVPHEATAHIDVRFIPEDEESIIKTLEKIVGADGQLVIILKESSQFSDTKNKYMHLLEKAVTKKTQKKAEFIVKHGGSDVSFFNSMGCPGVTFGPVGHGLHTDNEWVSIKSLERYYDILKSFLLSIK